MGTRASRFVPCPVSAQVTARAVHNARALGSGHGFRGVSEIGAAAISYLNEYQAFVITHDQVDFTALAAVIRGNQFEAVPAQIAAGALFSVVSQ